MPKDQNRIDEPEIQRDERGKIKSVSVAFGPHHFVEIYLEAGRVNIALGATHHGVRADAADVPSDFEALVEELKRAHPDKAF